MGTSSEKYDLKIWEQRFCDNEKGRPRSEYRGEYVRDRARVIHSAGFRRLQAKTQVLGIAEGDFHRTRLTHSLEVAQIARGIVLFLRKNYQNRRDYNHLVEWIPGQNLIETISLAHDLGHPPYGHGGEVALNYSMRKYGGFEGNGQTLRMLTRLEAHTPGCGLNLTRRSLFGVLKYPVVYEDVVRKVLVDGDVDAVKLKMSDWRPPKCYMGSESDIVEWVMRQFPREDINAMQCEVVAPSDYEHGRLSFHGLDTSIMDLADDIAYAVHDFEDAISLQLIYREQWEGDVCDFDEAWLKRFAGYSSFGSLMDDLFSDSSSARKWAIGALGLSAEVNGKAWLKR
jgi:dGTPase